MDMAAMVSDACYEACPHTRDWLASMSMEDAMDMANMGRRMQAEMQPRGMLRTVCCVSSSDACSGIASFVEDHGMLCSRASRLTALREEFPDNGDGCEGNCTGALDFMADFMFVEEDTPRGNQDGSPSLAHLARLRRHVCGNRDVVSCLAVSSGAGYEACEYEYHYHDQQGRRLQANPMDPETLLSQCDDALAVTVSMALTVDNPAEFVQDDANRMAVEDGIASAAGVEAEAVEAVLTVAQRRLQESLRRLQDGSGTVDVAATIHTADATAAEDLLTTIGNIDAATMTESIAAAFEDASINITITVTDVAPPAVQTASEAAASEGTGNSGGSETNNPSQDGALKTSVTTGIFAASAIFALTM